MPPLRAVIFDMDGLLIDTEPIWRRSEVDVFRSVGLHLTEDRFLETMGVRIAQVVELWYSRHPWEGASTAEVTRRIVDEVIRHVREEGEPMPGVFHALRTVRSMGLPIAIASSSGEDLIRAVVERLGIGDYIDAICSGEAETEGKPHPAVYLRAAGRLGVRPQECLALEDSPNGILSAKAAGMTCIAIPDPYLAADPRMNEADVRLASLEDLTPDVLLKAHERPARV